MHDEDCLYLSQGKYVTNLLHGTSLDESKPASMLMFIGKPLNKMDGVIFIGPLSIKG